MAGAVAFVSVFAVFWFDISWAYALICIAVWLGLQGLFFLKQRHEAEAPAEVLSPAAAETAARRKMVPDFGAFLQEARFGLTDICDQSILPHPKGELLDALCLEISRTDDAVEREALKAGAIMLANYQPGVGAPLKQLGVDLAALDAANPRELAHKIANNPAAGRWAAFNEKVEAELITIQAKIAAASHLAEMMTPEKKREVFGA